MKTNIKNKKWQWWKALGGGGFIAGAADDDPVNVATGVQAGAKFGYGFLWAFVLATPLMVVVQEMAGRISLAAGKGLAGVLRKYYGAALLIPLAALLVLANIFNIGADLGVIAASLEAVLPVHFLFWAGITALAILMLEISTTYKTYSKILRWTIVALGAYVITALIVKQDWLAVLKGAFIPHLPFTKEAAFLLIAVLGANISPYLFFWEASEEVEDEIEDGARSVMKRKELATKKIPGMRLDTIVGMIFSNLISAFIVLTAAGTLFKAGIFNINTAQEAAEALRPLAGHFTYLVFTLGIIGAGLLAIPVLAGSAAYAFSEAMGWQADIDAKAVKKRGFYAIIVVAMLVGFLMNFFGLNPIRALIYSGVINGIITVPILLVMLFAANNKRVMGQFKNGAWANILGILTLILMAGAAILFFVLK